MLFVGSLASVVKDILALTSDGACQNTAVRRPRLAGHGRISRVLSGATESRPSTVDLHISAKKTVSVEGDPPRLYVRTGSSSFHIGAGEWSEQMQHVKAGPRRDSGTGWSAARTTPARGPSRVKPGRYCGTTGSVGSV